MTRRFQHHVTATCVITCTALFSGCSTTKPEPISSVGATSPTPVSTCARTLPGVGARRLAPVRQSSSLALAATDETTLAYVADSDSHALLTMDMDASKQLVATPLAGAPEHVIVLADGRVAVSLRTQNLVQILEPKADPNAGLAPLCQLSTHAEPVALALTPDDRQLLVTSAWGRRLTAYSAATGVHRFDVPLAREPRAVVVDDEGERAFVAHVVGAQMSVVELRDEKHEVREIDLRVTAASRDPHQTRSGCQGFALAKSVDMGIDSSLPAGRLFAPMVTVNPGNPEVVASGYGDSSFGIAAEASLVSVVDANAERALTKTALRAGHSTREECILPRSAAISSAKAALYVTCLGSDALVELDARSVDPSQAERRRWLLPKGPTGVAVDESGERAAVWSQFDRALSVVSLKDESLIERVWVPENTSRLDAKLALGRVLFHTTGDQRISQDGRACASCHPDGREDAITWSTPVGPRQTIMLAGRVTNTAPYSWLGNHASLQQHLQTTFERLGGFGFDGDERDKVQLEALLAYLESMPAPVQENGRTSTEQRALVLRGETLFHNQEQGCSNCHLGASGTDASAHNVASGTNSDTKKAFDTPSLRFVGGTAPYFHDGRHATLQDLLRSTDANMGHTFHLSQRDVRAMTAYLETL